MSEKSMVRLYWFICFWFSLSISFISAIYVIFLTRSVGLSKLQANKVNMFFAIGCFLFELPTGVFADRFGRKRSFIVACFVFSFSLLVYSLAKKFWICVLAEVMSSLGHAFYSGSLEAWLVDGLGGRNLNFVFKREEQINQFGSILGAVCGGLVALNDIRLPWICGGSLFLLLGIFCCFAMNDDSGRGIPCSRRSACDIFRDGVGYGFSNKSVWRLVCLSTTLFFVCQPLNMFWQIHFSSFGLNTMFLGFIFSGISISMILGGECSSFFSRMKGDWNGLLFSQLIVSVAVAIAAFKCSLSSTLIFFLIHELGRGSFRPLKKAYINHRIPNDVRATVISFCAAIEKIGMATGLIFSGWIAETYSISFSWLVSSVILFSVVAVFVVIGNGEQG